MVEQYSSGEIIYPAADEEQSYRDLLHESLINYPWYSFGIDLLIGSEADRTITVREKMFMPSYLMDAFEEAVIVKNDSLSLPLVDATKLLLEQKPHRNSLREQAVLSPFFTAFALFLFALLISLIQAIKLNESRLYLLFDSLLFGITGIGGGVIFFLMYFSSHPATNPNWNLVWLHPVALVAVLFFWVKSGQRAVYFYHFINFVLLTLFLLGWCWIPQQLPLATIPFAMSVWIRSATNLFLLRNKRIKSRRFTSSREMKAAWGQ